jgi:hypothetical protein
VKQKSVPIAGYDMLRKCRAGNFQAGHRGPFPTDRRFRFAEGEGPGMVSRLALALVAGMLVHLSGMARSAEMIGIPDCDRFITSYETCVTNKVPADHRGTFSQQVAQLRASWRSLAENPQTRAQLEQVCRTQGAQMQRGLEPFGCSFP